MTRHLFGAVTALLAGAAAAAAGQPETLSLAQQHWYEARTAYFHIYSCGPTQEVARVAMRLEQFRNAGMRFSGFSPDGLVEIIEVPSHPWFLATQFHPEFQSRPLRPHPLFLAFVGARLDTNAAYNTVSLSTISSSGSGNANDSGATAVQLEQKFSGDLPVRRSFSLERWPPDGRSLHFLGAI